MPNRSFHFLILSVFFLAFQFRGMGSVGSIPNEKTPSIASTLTVTIIPPAGSTTLCSGVSLIFTGNANPGPITSWHWSSFPTTGVIIQYPTQNGTGITFNTSGSYTITLVATNNLGVTDSTTYPLIIYDSPTVSISPITPTVCLGGTGTTLFATMTPASIATGATYTWTPTTFLSSFNDSASVNPAPVGVYTYQVIGTGSDGCVSAPATVSVTVITPPSPTVTVVPDTICSGTSSTITVNGMPSNTTYTWTAAATAGLGTNSSYISSATPVYTGTVDTVFAYTINLALLGCPAYPTLNANLTVAPTPTVDMVADTMYNCNHTGDSLKAITNPLTGVQLSWSPTTGLLSSFGSPVFANPSSQMWYYVTPSLNGCVGKRDSVLVKLSCFALTMTVTPPTGVTTYCSNLPYQFTGNANPGPITFWHWTCNPSAGVSILNPNQNGTNVIFGSAGTYTLQVLAINSHGIRDSITYSLTVAPSASISVLPPNPTVCLGGTGTTLFAVMTPTNLAVGATYSWTPTTSLVATGNSAVVNPPGIGPFTYSVFGTSSNGCVGPPGVVTVTVIPAPTPTLVVIPDTICAGSSTMIFIKGMPSNTTYTWSAVANAGLGTNSGDTTTATPVYTGTVNTIFNYTVNMNLPGCPTYSAMVQPVTVFPTPLVDMVADTMYDCNHAGDSLKAITSPVTGVTLSWSPPTGLLTTFGNPVFANPTIPTWYYVTPTLNGCVGRRDSVLVKINCQTLSINILPPAGVSTYCAGIPFQFTGNANPGPIAYYHWTCTPPAGVSIQYPNQNGTNITFNNPGNYTLTLVATSNAGVTDSTHYSLTVAPTPSVGILPSNPVVCQGGSGTTLVAVMTPTNLAIGATYTWTPTTFLVASGNSALVDPTVLGTYTYSVVGIGGNGCPSAPVAVTVTVIPIPVASVTAVPDTICSGSSTLLSVIGMPSSTTYTWSAAVTAGLGTNFGSSANATPIYHGLIDSNYVYTVNMYIAGCPPFPALNMQVTVIPTPTVQTAVDTMYNCNHTGDTLKANTLPLGGVNLTWSPITGLSPITGSPVFANPNTPMWYYVTPTFNGCVGKKDSVLVLLNCYTLSITIAPLISTGTFCAGNPYHFTGNANPGPIIYWNWTSTPSTGVNIQFPHQNGTDITFASSGSYTLMLVAINANGITDSTKYNVTVVPSATLTTSPSIVQICQGGTGTTIFANILPSSLATGATYTWTPLTSLTSFGDSATVNPPANGVYTYSVTATASDGCKTASAPITVTVTPPPIPTITAAPDTLCSGTSSTITVTGMPLSTTYTWTSAPNAGLGTNSGSFTSITPVFNGLADTLFNYFVNMNIPGCPPYPQYTVQVTDVPTPTVETVSDTVDNCNHTGDSLRALTSPATGVTVNWTPVNGLSQTSGNTVFANPLGQIKYYATPTYNGCKGKRDSVLVRIGDSTNAAIKDEYLIICNGMYDTLFAQPIRTPLNNTYHYSWQPAIGISSTSPTGSYVLAHPLGTTVYTLTVIGTCVKRHTAEITIAVNNCVKPTPSFSVTMDTICVNHCVTFTDLTPGLRPHFYTWIFTGGSPALCTGCVIPHPGSDTLYYAAADSAPIPQIKVCYHINSQNNVGGSFPVTEIVGTGLPNQTATVTSHIVVSPGPKAVTDYIGGNPSYNPTIQMGQNITLDGTHSQGTSTGTLTYSWSPNFDLSCTTCPQPVVNPSVTTTYSLLVTDGSMCYDTASITVYVDLSCFQPFVPTGFSPNGDGENDILYVRSICLNNFIFKVFDRWGELVFQTTDLSYGWDGTFRSRPMNAGVFVFTLDGYMSNNTQVKLKGNVTLVR